MGKRPFTLKIRIPQYAPSRNEWRRKIHAELVRTLNSHSIEYTEDDKIELRIILYMRKNEIVFHDVDNRLKDIMDALQGRMGGSKKKHEFKRIISNDKQIYKVTIEKRTPPKQSLGLGHLLIREYKETANN